MKSKGVARGSPGGKRDARGGGPVRGRAWEGEGTCARCCGGTPNWVLTGASVGSPLVEGSGHSQWAWERSWQEGSGEANANNSEHFAVRGAEKRVVPSGDMESGRLFVSDK